MTVFIEFENRIQLKNFRANLGRWGVITESYGNSIRVMPRDSACHDEMKEWLDHREIGHVDV